MTKVFQIKLLKDYIRSEQTKIINYKMNNIEESKLLDLHFKDLEKLREEINQANKLLREKFKK